MKTNYSQILLIVAGLVASALLGIFFYREISPEYKIYQEKYIALENFRSTYTNDPAPPFKMGVKQIVLEQEDKGPPVIDRCISCHVALQIEDFSPTKIARDINGNIILDEQGFPQKIENANYIWKKLDEKIQDLAKNGKDASQYKALKQAHVGEYVYDVEKVLQMHPLMGRETRPFEYHPIEEYGCTSCHGGNGRGLVTDRAHGPVFDGQYETEFQGYKPQFLEADRENDPEFSKVFNDKPGHRLLFQTNPIYVGALIQAKCMQCHQEAESAIKKATGSANRVLNRNESEISAIQKGYNLEINAVLSLAALQLSLGKDGYDATLKKLQSEEKDYTLTMGQRDKAASQIKFLKNKERAFKDLHNQLLESFGSEKLLEDFSKAYSANPQKSTLDEFINSTQEMKEATGTLYRKAEALALNQAILRHVLDVKQSFQAAVNDENTIGTIQTDVDRLTKDYGQGKNLFISQACYACHRIAGFSRGGVGPELTQSGDTYPWYLKQKISNPQFDLHNSTMPNYRLDHEELQDLVTYLLAQKGPGKKFSDLNYKTDILEWEAGKKQHWEESVPPTQIHDVRYGMTVFATEGCAACHRLKGYESNVGFQVEKEKKQSLSFEDRYREQQWFKQLFPEFIRGTDIIAKLERDGKEINKRIVDNVRQNSILEEIQKRHPGIIESLYTNFKFASRAQNHRIATLLKNEKDENKKAELTQELKDWKALVRRVLMMYIQEYGLGRIICPRPNWSGVYRTDQWLMEHFRNPTSHVPRSIMPVFPFDDTKFYALTYMLDVLAQKNSNEDREEWQNYGFNPELAFQKYCSQCHGEHLYGNGPVAEWIYPIPKNLRRADFLRNLTKENVIQSITHGVKGTPMPPWGEVGQDKPFANNIPVLTASEIKLLADWLFSSLPGGTIIRGSEEVPKWQYEPEDVLKELKEEGGELKGAQFYLEHDIKDYIVSLNPVVAQVAPLKVEDVFDTVKMALPTGGEEVSYYIKKKFYTPENILQGQHLFFENCAPCHGREADGSGLRAEAMHEAKPRMLINLDWLQTRDDLRLLRSIKYGVPGTSMTPWGDQTSSLQRMQLVMFIRSLTQSQGEKTHFVRAIYRIFDNAEFLVERARIEEYSHLAALQKELNQARQARENFDRGILRKTEDKQAAIEAYQKELDVASKLEMQEKSDLLYQELRQKIKQEKELYSASGLGFLAANSDEQMLDIFMKLIALNENRYEITDGKLLWKDKNFNVPSFNDLKEKIIAKLDSSLKDAEEQKTIITGKVSSPERTKEMTEIEAKIDVIKKQKARFLSNLSEAMRLKAEQKNIFDVINNAKGAK